MTDHERYGSAAGSVLAPSEPGADGASPAAADSSVERSSRSGARRNVVAVAAALAIIGGATLAEGFPRPALRLGAILASSLLLHLGAAWRWRAPGVRNTLAALSVVPLLFLWPDLLRLVPPWSGLDPSLRLLIASLMVGLATLLEARGLRLPARSLLLRTGIVRAYSLAGRRTRSSFARVSLGVLSVLVQLCAIAATALAGLVVGMSAPAALISVPGVAGFDVGPRGLLAVLLLTAVAVELLFRGLVQGSTESLLGRWGAVLLQALVFAIASLAVGPASSALLLFALATGLGLAALLTRSLIGTVVANAFVLMGAFGILSQVQQCLPAAAWHLPTCWWHAATGVLGLLR